MENTDIERVLRQSVGTTVTITFGGLTETVFINSVDPDGFLCRTQSEASGDPHAEFWIAYSEVTHVTAP